MGKVRRAVAGTGILMGAYAVVALVIHVVFPLPLPDTTIWPRVGDVLRSRSERVEQTVLAVEGDQLVTELVLLPRAPGPPMLHYHQTFPEIFVVAEGTLSVELEDRTITLGPGQRFPAQPGVRHRPFNPTDQRVVIRGDEVRVPAVFGVCLSNLYRVSDAHPGGIATLLQMSVMQGFCDVHFTGLFGAIQRPLLVALEPIARAAGFRSFYPSSVVEHRFESGMTP